MKTATDKVEVIVFPRPCNHCKSIMFPVEKMHATWLECRNDSCSYLAGQNEEYPDMDPMPFVYAVCRR